MTQEEMLSQMEEMPQPLQQVNASQAETIKKLTSQNESLQSRIKELQSQIAWLNRQLYGRKSEKLPVFDSGQLNLFAEELAALQAQADGQRDEAVARLPKEERLTPKEKRQVRQMTEDLPVLEQVRIRPEGIDEDLYKKIGEEITRVVEHEPGRLYVREIIREKWALRDNTQLPPKGMTAFLIAPMPLLPIYREYR